MRAPFPIRRPRAVLVVAAVLSVGAAAIASRLSVKADLSHLLPPGAASVRDLEAVQRRAQAFGNLLVGVEADDPAVRAGAARQLISRLRSLDPALVAGVIADDGSLRRHLWNNRYQYVPIEDLEQVRDDLQRRIAKANPLFVDLSDDSADERGGTDRLAALRARLDDAQSRALSPTPLVSKDGRTQMIIVRATFPSADASKARRLNDLVQAAIAEARAAGPAVRIGATGDIATVVVEQNAIVRGMTVATLITTVVVALALLLYYRSLAALAVIFGALGVGTIATLAFARLSVGFLNSATAFLISIVIGNGINFPMLVVARYLEERRRALPNLDAVGRASTATLRGTTTAALTAFVAYGSLIVTDFRGFRDFGIIGAVGMLLCWAAAYTVAPALLTVLGRRGLFDRLTPEPSLGRRLAGLLPRRSRPAVAALALLAPVLLAMAGRYLASDPFEYNLRNLRASGAEARQARVWQTKLDEAFGKGISGGFVIALERGEDAPALANQLRVVTGATTTGKRGPLLSRVSSLSDLLPAEQERRFALLQEVRRLIDRHAHQMPDETAALARRLRPPDGLRPLRAEDVPAELALQYTEKDGRRGRLIFANTAPSVNGWDGRDLRAVSQQVRSLDLPAGTRVAGSAFVFADMIEAIRRDGPKATLVALIGVLIVIALTMGVGRHGRLTALAAVFGTTAMLALSSLAGVKINFLDFVALPLTLGIGTDYAANVLSRAREDAHGATRHAVLTTGGVVVLCSFTTIVGYASLLAADNAGIRSFGLAATLGELTCIVAGVWVAPVLLDALERRRARPRSPRAPGRSPWWQRAVMLAGAVGFLVMVRSLPHADWRALVVRVGPALPIAAAITLGWMALYARGLGVILGDAVRLGRLVYNRVVGDAYNVITPLAGAGGDPVRVMDLAAEVGTAGAVRAIVIDRLVYSTAGLLFSGLGAAVAVWAFAWDRRIERLLIGYALVALAGTVLLTLLTTRPAAARGIAGVLRFAKVRLPEIPAPLPTAAFARALGWHLLGRAGALVEIAVLLVALGQPVRLAGLIAASAVISIAGIVFFFVPSGVGVNEGAAVLALTLSGYGESVGLAVGLARRARQLLMTGAGVVLTMIRRPGRQAAA
jgi:predicted RND superfamily exporter protein/uncharacterized membrane protein YbhN (UPF0104 family)